MQNRFIVLGLAAFGGLGLVAARLHAAAPQAAVHVVTLATDDDHDGKDKGEKKDKHEHEYNEKEIEQAVPMAMVPAAVLDAVKKELPNGTITEAELVAKKGKIMYSFDVKAGDVAYEVKISVDGKFVSKKVDDDGDDDKGEKK